MFQENSKYLKNNVMQTEFKDAMCITTCSMSFRDSRVIVVCPKAEKVLEPGISKTGKPSAE